MSDKILVSVDSNESARPRFDKIKEAIAGDEHFELNSCGCLSLPFDIHFRLPANELHVEVKDFTGEGNSDYLSSILSGHLWEQVTAARELGEPFVLAVLGDDHDIQGSIRKAAGFRPTGNMDKFDLKKFMQYSALLDGFEANCIGCNMQVWHLGYNQFPRLLLRVRKLLEGGDLSGFCPKPADRERNAVALSIAAGRGVGVKKAHAVLEHFQLSLLPKEDAYEPLQLLDIPGIGPKLAAQIRMNISVVE